MPAARIGIRVTGVVQGVGFRPFVHALATSLGLTGFVGNDAAGVRVEVQGPSSALAALIRRLEDDAPPLAVVEDIRVQHVPFGADEQTFRVVPSASGAGTTSIPPDTAVCDSCLAEMRDPADRRFGYPFIACAQCGPRLTITVGLPYDRASTTMAGFPLCPQCRAEFEDPTSRRFHAQPTACPECGPSLTTSVRETVEALRSGLIVALKGVGGYHLACDARRGSSVRALRRRKGRGGKPFALMAADLAIAGQVAHLDALAAEVMSAPARPIVVLAARDRSLAGSVAPGTGTLGVMLPYAPLHHLLFDAGAPPLLVMTSGNLSDEPICTDPQEAQVRLADIADAFCHHDRPIHVACDDSVLRVARGAVLPVRRGRGYAPLPRSLPVSGPAVLAVGGELKATACLARDGTAWLSQHVGDMASLEAMRTLQRTVGTLGSLLRLTPQAVACDAHPGYASTHWARERAAALGVPLVRVQHHHAHLAALLAEHGVPAGDEVLGIVCDGTGYGDDATIWGGELLLGSYREVRRVGHLGPVPLPGGDAAIRHPARTALAHLHAAGLAWDATESARAMTQAERSIVARMLQTGSHCTPTTSMGRLFDAVASLLGVCHEVDYEAQAALELEALAEAADQPAAGWGGSGGEGGPVLRADAVGGGGPVHGADAVVIDPAPWIAQAVADHAQGIPAARSALAFHLSVAQALAAAAVAVRERHDVTTVGLSGGVFTNAVLSDACQQALQRAGFQVLVHRGVPANDGGLALGQAAVATARLAADGR